MGKCRIVNLMSFACGRCGTLFVSRQALGGHLSYPTCADAETASDDMNAEAVSDDIGSSKAASELSNTYDTANAEDNVSDANDSAVASSAEAAEAAGANVNASAANNVTCAPVMSTLKLLERPLFEYNEHRVLVLDVPQRLRCNTAQTFRLHETQQVYAEYCDIIRDEYCQQFWGFFSAVYLQQNVVIDATLKACRSTFISDKTMKTRFPSSVREIRARTLACAGDFPSLITHVVTIDLREFELPGIDEVTFRFVNPLWAWVAAANDMLDAGHEINFKPKAMYHETTKERLFGAGVAFGEKLKWAWSRTPAGGKPALFGISFDGAESGISNRTMYPICVSVLNFDGSDPLALALVGYVPTLDVPKAFKIKKSRLFLAARAHVFQQCVGAILAEIEHVSEHGFTADLKGERVRMHPFLVAVQVDSKERKTYFGLKSDRSGLGCLYGVHIIAHIWGSYMGFICGVHMWCSMWGSYVGFTCGVHNFSRVEHVDPSPSHLRAPATGHALSAALGKGGLP